MPKCKKCGSQFKIPEFTIEIIETLYCKTCIKAALQKMANMPVKDYMNTIAKSIIK